MGEKYNLVICFWLFFLFFMTLFVPKGYRCRLLNASGSITSLTIAEDTKVPITGYRDDKKWWLGTVGGNILVFTNQQVEELEQDIES